MGFMQPWFYVVGDCKAQMVDAHVPQYDDDDPFPACMHCKQTDQSLVCQ